MLVSYNWLKEFVDIADSPSDLAERITMAGLEVEAVTDLEEGFKNVVVGQIVSRDPVQDSDHLTVCQVDVGKESLQIICGAPNHRVGDKVVVAVPGAVLSGGMKIGSATIRGVESKGMICSEKELGISDKSNGVLILPEESKVGARASEALGRQDTILEVDLTPNRPDALSHLGVARDVAALTGCSLKVPGTELVESGPETSSLGSVEVQDAKLCPRYMGRVITGVTVGPSPSWIQHRLRAVGIRPINNIVDVTNYVLMEWGHPLHAFDYDRLSGHRIVVRRASQGEAIHTLDEAERTLDSSMLVICDADKPVAVAGVMGGADSEVREETHRIFLEAACFEPTSIRRTSRKLGLHSESSHRFERGTDIEGMAQALDRAASLIQKLAGGKIAKERIDHYPEKRPLVQITVRYDRIRSLLGIELSQEEVQRIFKGLSLTVAENDEKKMVVKVPSYRLDLTREIDVIEEVARVYGYNKIPTTLPKASIVSGNMTAEQRLTGLARRIFAGRGYSETIHYSFHNPRDLDVLGLAAEDSLRSQIRIRNPLSEDQSVLRSSMIPGLIHTFRRNLKRSSTDIRIFEIGRVFEPRDSGLPLEKNRLAGLVAGKDRPSGWDIPPRDLDFFDLKGDLLTFLDRIGIQDMKFLVQERFPFLHPGKSAWIESRGSRLGFLGELHPSVMKRFELAQSALCFEMDLDACFREASHGVDYVPVPRYPWVERDIAMILSEEIAAGEVEERIRDVEPELIREIRLFDLYRGKPIPSGKKSLAFSIRFQSPDRTLTDEEVNRVRDNIVSELSRAFNAALRE